MLLDTSKKDYTKEVKTKTAIIIAGIRINLYINGGISFDNYDKITTEKPVVLPTGNVLPIAIVKEKYTEYHTVGAKLTILAAEELLHKRLMDRLMLKIGDGEVVQATFDTSIEGDVIKVTLRAECLEQIAAERPFTADEIQKANEVPSPEPKAQ
jgi:similar to stage IV sporulation protein